MAGSDVPFMSVAYGPYLSASKMLKLFIVRNTLNMKKCGECMMSSHVPTTHLQFSAQGQPVLLHACFYLLPIPNLWDYCEAIPVQTVSCGNISV